MSSVIGTTLAIVQPILLTLIVLSFLLLGVNAPIALVLFVMVMAFVLQPLGEQSPTQSTYFQSCVNHSTLASCRKSAEGTCSGLYETFQNDPEWAAYRQRLCDPTLKSASLNRLSTSYNPSDCVYGECSQECIDTLNRIQLDMFAFGCGPETIENGFQPFVDPGEVMTLSPLYGQTFRIMGWTGMALVLLVVAFKFGRYIIMNRSG